MEGNSPKRLSNIVKRIFKKKNKKDENHMEFDDNQSVSSNSNKEKKEKLIDVERKSISINEVNNNYRINDLSCNSFNTQNIYSINDFPINNKLTGNKIDVEAEDSVNSSILDSNIDSSMNSNISSSQKSKSALRKEKTLKSKNKKFLNIINLEEYLEEKERIKQRKIILGKLKVITSIDNLYFNISEEHTNYFEIHLGWILSLSILIASFCFWIVIGQREKIYNSTYCFDTILYEYKICEEKAVCINTQTKDLENSKFYLDNETLYNLCLKSKVQAQEYFNNKYFIIDGEYGNSENTSARNSISICDNTRNLPDYLYQLRLINLVFKDFSIKEYLIFRESSNLIANYKNPNTNIFQSLVVITTDYNFSLHIFMNNLCFNYKMNVVVNWLVFNILGFLVGSIIFSILADIYGRKKILLIGLGLISFYCLSSFLLFLLSSLSSDYDLADFYNKVNELLVKDSQILALGDRINDYYLTTIKDFTNMKLNSQSKLDNLSIIKLFYILNNTICSVGVASIFISALALILESSLNSNQLHNNYKKFMFGLLTSNFFQYFFSRIINSYPYLHLLPLIISIMCFILINKFIRESPRLLFEYADYQEITNLIIEKNLLIDLNRYLIEENDQLLKYEFNLKNNINFFSLISLPSIALKEDLRKSTISRFKFLSLIFKNKKLVKNLTVLFSLSMIITCSHYFSICNYSKMEFTTKQYRDNHFSVFYNFRTYIDIFKILALFLFSFINQYFGMKIILNICFIMCFCFTLCFGILELNKEEIFDFDKYYNGSEIISEKYHDALKSFISIIIFFSAGPFISVFIYITRFTRTIYRCTVFGFFFLLFQSGGYIGYSMYEHFNNNMLYIALINFIGFILSLFIEEDIEEAIVIDYRKVRVSHN